MFQTALNQGTTATDTALDVELRKVFKVFNGETAVRGVDLEIHQGEFFSILGPSGCGKTTTLRLIAGFETPSAGELMIRGQSMTNTPAYRRPVNTVFQSYALFGHMNVWDNIAFGLRIKKLGKAEIEERVREALQLVKMESFANRFPGQMSGGQQQRVALARALVNRPAVLLLDEPLGALDLKLRKQMQLELSNLHQELGLTFVMVTHDQEEAMSLSDRIAVMNEGRIEQIGSPEEIYECPQTAFVADFIGDTNLFAGKVESIDRSTLTVRTPAGLKIVVQQSDMWSGGTDDSVVVSVRPEKVYLNLYQPEVSVNCFEGRLKNIMYMGTHVHYVVELTTGDKMTVRQPNTGGSFPDPHTPIYAYWGTSQLLVVSC
ncbi:MAG: ABC transporter ATP-binding protein [Oscillatoriales cyanobacterium]|nr:MAG: ABC transporter ATP-binding protein [Oscillatoriales cyanobacterium]